MLKMSSIFSYNENLQHISNINLEENHELIKIIQQKPWKLQPVCQSPIFIGNTTKMDD